MRYSEDFYKMVLDAKYTPPTLTKFAYYNGIVVGAIACRTERARANYDAPGVVQKLGEADTDALYIMTLAVLAPYRRLGIGASAAESVSHARAARYFSVLTARAAPPPLSPPIPHAPARCLLVSCRQHTLHPALTRPLTLLSFLPYPLSRMQRGD